MMMKIIFTLNVVFKFSSCFGEVWQNLNSSLKSVLVCLYSYCALTAFLNASSSLFARQCSRTMAGSILLCIIVMTTFNWPVFTLAPSQQNPTNLLCNCWSSVPSKNALSVSVMAWKSLLHLQLQLASFPKTTQIPRQKCNF